MTRALLRLLCALSMMALPAISAHAASANFQGNCDTSSNCVFDANRTPSGQTPTSCGSSTASLYFWDFGDGTSFFTTSSFVSHSYVGNQCLITVQLAVFCADGSSATKSHCFCNTLGVGGCIYPGAGWKP